MANQDKPVLLVNPGGRVVEVNKAHAEILLNNGEGFEKAPKGTKQGEMLGDVRELVISPAQNNLVPNGTSEKKAAKIAALQGTKENAKLQAAADPTNKDVVAPVVVDPTSDSGAGTQDAPEGDGNIDKFLGRK